MTASQPTNALPQVMGVPVPLATGLDKPFHDGLLAHELWLQQCGDCATWQWPPEVICHRCRGFGPGWTQVEPEGVIFSWTRVWHPAREELTAAVPYVVVVAELPQAGGARLVGNLLDDEPVTPIEVGRAVRGVFSDQHSAGHPYTLLQWRYADC